MKKQLPIIKVKGNLYYLDEKLRELRAVDNPNNRQPLPKCFVWNGKTE